MSEYKGFRFGVRSFTAAKASPLAEIVSAELSREPGDLPALDLIELGAVYVNEARALDPSLPVRPGDAVRVHASPRRFPRPKDLGSRILNETADTLLIEKPANFPTEPTVDNSRENLMAALDELRGQRHSLVHRLAPESEGLLLVAKTEAAAERLARAFAEGRVARGYVAYLEAPVKIGPHADGALEIKSCLEQRAETSQITENRTIWIVSGRPLSVCYRIELVFASMRPKEVREHFKACGAPILGDKASGSRIELLDERGKATMAFLATSLEA